MPTNGHSQLVKYFKAARRVSTPLVCVRTPDPTATMAMLSAAVAPTAPRIVWDCVRGPQGLNQPNTDAPSSETQTALSKYLLKGKEARELAPPVACLLAAGSLPESTVLFCLNLHRHIENPLTIQAIWNLRDIFKANRRTLVILSPDIKLPPELSNDFAVLDEPLPTTDELSAIITAQCSAIQHTPPQAMLIRAIDATLGLAAFSAEQVVAMSLTDQGIDLDGLWERKRQNIEQAPGLSVWRGNESLGDVRGADNVIRFMTSLISGNDPARAIVFIDEIEKGTAGAEGDSSGVSQDMHGTLLTYMQDHKSTGMLFLGPAGTGKSFAAKGAGNKAGIPTIKLDMGGMKASHVGESEARLRNALKVIEAVSQHNALFIATCNSIGSLSPELRRRFKFGTFFFDLPNKEERRQLWALYMQKYKRKGSLPDDTDWTGAEIENCCEISYKLNCSLVEAGSYIVPVAKSAADQIKALRTQASGCFISASKPGLYTYEPETEKFTGRRIAAIEE
jgi:hypothetical protein